MDILVEKSSPGHPATSFAVELSAHVCGDEHLSFCETGCPNRYCCRFASTRHLAWYQ